MDAKLIGALSTIQSMKREHSKTIADLKQEIKTLAQPYLTQLEVSAMTGEDHRSQALLNYRLLAVKDSKIAELNFELQQREKEL